MPSDRREHQRLAVRLPLECRFPGAARALRSCTSDISAGGVFFELNVPQDLPVPQVNSVLELSMIVPPGPGHSPYQGRVSAAAEVLRCRPVDAAADAGTAGCERFGIAVRFKQALQLKF